jgi:hypothetical protein
MKCSLKEQYKGWMKQRVGFMKNEIDKPLARINIKREDTYK